MVQAGFCDAILPAIPLLVELLKSVEPNVRTAAVSTLTKIASHGESQNTITMMSLMHGQSRISLYYYTHHSLAR